jgi:hypothetical protein
MALTSIADGSFQVRSPRPAFTWLPGIPRSRITDAICASYRFRCQTVPTTCQRPRRLQRGTLTHTAV